MEKVNHIRECSMNGRMKNPNGFKKAKAGGQKFLKHLHELNTKLHGKHWLYTVLAFRFNEC